MCGCFYFFWEFLEFLSFLECPPRILGGFTWRLQKSLQLVIVRFSTYNCFVLIKENSCSLSFQRNESLQPASTQHAELSLPKITDATRTAKKRQRQRHPALVLDSIPELPAKFVEDFHQPMQQSWNRILLTRASTVSQTILATSKSTFSQTHSLCMPHCRCRTKGTHLMLLPSNLKMELINTEKKRVQNMNNANT